MKFSFVEGTKSSDTLAKKVPNNKPIVSKWLVLCFNTLLVKSTKIAVQRHVRQENLPS
jgi:hypothetical protein